MKKCARPEKAKERITLFKVLKTCQKGTEFAYVDCPICVETAMINETQYKTIIPNTAITENIF